MVFVFPSFHDAVTFLLFMITYGQAFTRWLIRPCSQLFGEDEDASGELDDAEKQGENGMFHLASCVFVLNMHGW